MRYLGATLIGLACAMLQAEQPQSFIATVCLVVAAGCYDRKSS